MAVAKARANRDVNLPPEIWNALGLRAGDQLNAELVAGGVLLKPKQSADRQQGWDRVFSAMDKVKWAGPGPQPTDGEIMRQSVEDVHWARGHDESRD